MECNRGGIWTLMTFDCTKTSLQKGSKGSQVTELQKTLKKWGYYTGKIDGDYGNLTKTAVKKLQKATGHSQDGWFGEKTCKSYNEKLNSETKKETTSTTLDCKNINLKKGDKGTQVETLQKMLKELGYYTRQVDGDFGDYTDKALKQFQTDTKHDPDGVLGSKTCPDLNKAYSNKTTTKKTPTANNKLLTTKLNKEIIIDAKKYNFMRASDANCTIEGIHFIISQVDDTNSFKTKKWKRIDLMGDKVHKYQSHRQPLQYKLTTYLTDKEYKQVKNALILLQDKPSCKIVYDSIESGNYDLEITRAWYKTKTWKLTIDITEVIT